MLTWDFFFEAHGHRGVMRCENMATKMPVRPWGPAASVLYDPVKGLQCVENTSKLLLIRRQKVKEKWDPSPNRVKYA